jgi:hypothetical protein
VSDLVGNGGSMRKIPEDLKYSYELAKSGNGTGMWADAFAVRLIERVAECEAEIKRLIEKERETKEKLISSALHVLSLDAANARLKQPVTDEEWCNHAYGGDPEYILRPDLTKLLASRSKEPKGATNAGS